MRQKNQTTGSPLAPVGLSALRKILSPDPVGLDQLAGSTVAVDANNLLWTFVTGMARGGAPTGPHGRPISHLIGLANRLTLYAELDLSTVWVFDGAPPELKAETIAEREARRQAAKAAGKTLQATRLEGFQIDQARQLLDTLGIPSSTAPCEADAQLAHWVSEGAVDAAITQDYDIALHGCPVTFRNVKRTGRRATERLELATALEAQGITWVQLVDAAILIGTDYNDGIHGVGPVTALELVREHGDLWGALEARGVAMPRAEPVRSLFLDHPVEADPPVASGWPDRDGVRTLFEEHGLSQGRADALVDAVAPLVG